MKYTYKEAVQHLSIVNQNLLMTRSEDDKKLQMILFNSTIELLEQYMKWWGKNKITLSELHHYSRKLNSDLEFSILRENEEIMEEIHKSSR